MIGAFALGTAALGGMPFDTDVDLSVVVDGAERSAPVLRKRMVINHNQASRSTADITFADETKTLTFHVGQRIFVRWHGSMIFAGTLDEVESRVPETNTIKFSACKAVDFTQLLDRFRVAAIYEGLTLRQIVRDIILVQNEGALGKEGISTEEVQEGPVVEKANFNYRRVSDCFRDLADKTGFIWTLNPNRVLVFADRTTYAAPFSVDDSNRADLHSNSMRFNERRSDFRNHEFFRGGNDVIQCGTPDENGIQVGKPDFFRGDPASTQPEKRQRTFPLRYKLASIPTIIRYGSQNSPITGPQRVEIQGKAKDGDLTIPDWPQWYVQIGEKEITQNSSTDESRNPALSDADLLEVRFDGQLPIVIDARRDDLIAERAAIEGGTGVYQELDEDEEVDGRDLALQKAEAFLDRFGKIPRTLSYETFRSGLAVGQIQTQTLARFGLSAVEFLIDQVQTSLSMTPAGWRAVYRVRGLDGERPGGWVAWFRKKIMEGRPVRLHENESVLIARKFIEQVTFSDEVETSDDTGDLGPYTDDPYTVARVKVVTTPTDSIRIPAFRVGRSKIGRPRVSP